MEIENHLDLIFLFALFELFIFSSFYFEFLIRIMIHGKKILKVITEIFKSTLVICWEGDRHFILEIFILGKEITKKDELVGCSYRYLPTGPPNNSGN